MTTPRKSKGSNKASAKRKPGSRLCLEPLPLDLPCTRPEGHAGDHHWSRAQYLKAGTP